MGSSHETLPVPRVCGKQTKRSNFPHGTPDDYYRRAIFIPFLDHVLAELNTRFSDKTVPVAVHIRELLKGPTTNKELVLAAAEVYRDDVQSILVTAEINRWILTAEPMQSVENALSFAKARMFPNLAKLLTILLTLPVTNAEAERSFSVLKLVKTHLRSSMGQERLNGLALLAVHSTTNVSLQNVIDKFSQKNRHLLLR